MHSDTMGAWTPVAFSKDLPAATVMPARTEAGSIALWRSASGRVAASADRCPHRGMRLSHGFVRGEALSCIYHGWSYAQSGQCLRIPAHPGLTPPEAIRVVTYAAQEADGIIWVSASQTDDGPPRLEGLVPLRSLTVAANIAAIESAAGAKVNSDFMIALTTDVGAIWLLLSAHEKATTLVHVLLEEGSDQTAAIAASRIAERIRRQAEELSKRTGS